MATKKRNIPKRPAVDEATNKAFKVAAANLDMSIRDFLKAIGMIPIEKLRELIKQKP